MILRLGFQSYFLILASIMDFCRRENIPYGPGRGSVGGSLVAYVIGIHEADSLEWDLLFERFLNADRVSYPDVDIDISQRDRPRVLQFIRDQYEREGNVVLQVGAFARLSGRGVIDAVANARSEVDGSSYALAETLKGFLPKGNITGGTKQPRELSWWLESGVGDRDGFRELADKAGWTETLLKLDGLQTHLTSHAAGVVILDPQDLSKLPLAGANDTASGQWRALTGFDMYSLDDLGYLKLDILGLRTLDVCADAHRFIGGTGNTRELMQLWRDHRDEREPYELCIEGDTLGIFQFDTDGFRRTLRAFEPDRFDHLVQLTALYRPGALDYKRADGKNMVEVFIERRHGREAFSVPGNIAALAQILAPTHGVILYQEQAMQIARALGGWDYRQADDLRKAIGKKLTAKMAEMGPSLIADMQRFGGASEGIAQSVWENIAAAARYSWNKSHAVFYAIVTWWTMWFKRHHPDAFYAALLNSYDGQQHAQDLKANAIAEARQKVQIDPPDINVAEEGFTVRDGRVVFGLSGVKGLGPANRAPILLERMFGEYTSYEDTCRRLPSLPVSIKKDLVRCGAFDRLPAMEGHEASGARQLLLAIGPKSDRSDKRWTVAEHVNHNTKLKNPRPIPYHELEPPTPRELAEGEQAVVGFYISDTPLANVARALSLLDRINHYGGEIETIRRKKDRRGQEFAHFTVLTPALTRLRVTMFASVYERFGRYLEKGEQVVMRGRMDGDKLLVDLLWEPDDLRHFKHAKYRRDEQPWESVKLPTDSDSARQAEERREWVDNWLRAGYEVRLF